MCAWVGGGSSNVVCLMDVFEGLYGLDKQMRYNSQHDFLKQVCEVIAKRKSMELGLKPDHKALWIETLAQRLSNMVYCFKQVKRDNKKQVAAWVKKHFVLCWHGAGLSSTQEVILE